MIDWKFLRLSLPVRYTYCRPEGTMAAIPAIRCKKRPRFVCLSTILFLSVSEGAESSFVPGFSAKGWKIPRNRWCCQAGSKSSSARDSCGHLFSTKKDILGSDGAERISSGMKPLVVGWADVGASDNSPTTGSARLEHEGSLNFNHELKVDLLLNVDSSLNSPRPVLTLENLGDLTQSSDLAYFYLQNELGLSEIAMWKITHEAGSVLGMTADTLRRKVDLLQRAMDLTDEDLRTLVERQPAILHLSADKNLAPTILYLIQVMEFSKQDLRTIVVQFPCILCYSKVNLASKLDFFLESMKYSKEDCRALFVEEPKLLTAGVKTGLLPHLHFFVDDCEIPLESLRLIIQKNPRLMLYSLEDNLVPKVIFYLTMNLHMDATQLLRLLTTYPQLLDYNLENHILPITAYLMNELEFSPIEVRQILLKFPRFMTHSLFKIKHVVGFLRFELGLEAAQVKRVLYQAPQMVGVNTERTLKRKVEFIRDAFELSDDDLQTVVAGMPTLLICSIETNLLPKTEYLKGVFDNISDLREAIVTQPALLGYSLEKRIEPRMDRLLKIGGQPRAITIGIPMKEEAFGAWLEGRRKKLQKKNEADDKGALVHVGSKHQTESQDARIIHWTRERRRPSHR